MNYANYILKTTKRSTNMDNKTRVELYRKANRKLEATMDCMRNLYECVNEIQSNIFTIFYLLHIANKDVEDAVTIEVD